MTDITKEQKITFIRSLIKSGLDAWFDKADEALFNPDWEPAEMPYPAHASHVMRGVGEPNTMGWEGYACQHCWAREGTNEVSLPCPKQKG